MHIVVCIKSVPNPDVGPSTFRLDEVAKKIVLWPGVSLMINPFDEQAVEAALRIRENHVNPNEVSVTVITMGEASSVKIIKHALAMGADQGVILADSSFKEADSWTTAHVLAVAITKMGDVDIILSGRQATDTDAGVVGLGISEILNLPAITLAMDIDVTENQICVDRAVGSGVEKMVTRMPAVLTVAHEFGAVRFRSLRETMRANKKPIQTWGLEELGISDEGMGLFRPRTVIERLYKPIREVNCEWVSSEDLAVAATTLVAKLVQRKLI